MKHWIQQNGGEKVVLESDDKCVAMLKHEAAITSAPTDSVVEQEFDSGESNNAKAVAALRKEYHQDIEDIIKQNLESFSTLFQMRLDDIGKDLTETIEHQGDRLIKYLRSGPQNRIKDKVYSDNAPRYF